MAPFICRNTLLTGEHSTREAILPAHKDTMTGAKCHTCMIEIYLYLLKQSVSRGILHLIETAVRISEILYINDTEHGIFWGFLTAHVCTMSSKNIRFHSAMTYNN